MNAGSARSMRTFEWLSIAVLLLCIDFVTGFFIKFPLTFIVPVGLAAWHSGVGPSLLLALAMPFVRLWFEEYHWGIEQSMVELVSTALIRTLVLAAFAIVVADLASKRRLLAERVWALEGILPICSFCKKIRDDEGTWQPVERYVANHSDASFSHGFCEECMGRYYGEAAGESPAPRPEPLPQGPGRPGRAPGGAAG